MSVAKTFYKPLALASSIVGGLIASKVFSEIWQRANPAGTEPPDPEDLRSSMKEIFIAAALQGLIVGVVRAALARGQAKGFAALTDENPR
ncbi:membrane protein [Mycolicibacterium doricum]|uniref:Membrane protein n=1 Tax=Mycolicibacterium doricum TaxID=126673 RepID=A0A1X1TJC0_9MYCO|nr:DUF4235 domain-containing protein [Mycolicibacterium doricum]MCV7267033.1 DUF4235 domain-containing protein [Mycolicibacterium doricum]ORV44675.1 hypothetical protein AWC01_02875 [Mycolicibacterium doricum]BBZ08893.1 membrane protein [Mycolicibacterium doricum]